jgi:hypothetical protein
MYEKQNPFPYWAVLHCMEVRLIVDTFNSLELHGVCSLFETIRSVLSADHNFFLVPGWTPQIKKMEYMSWWNV